MKDQKAENLLKEMMGVLEKGGKLDQQKINYIADLSNEGISYKQENVMSTRQTDKFVRYCPVYSTF